MSDPKANPEAEKPLEKLSVKLLLATLKKSIDSNAFKFSFLLGSGASASSGIPTGGVLAEKWYKELEENLGEEGLKAWQEEEKKEDEEKSGLGDPKRYAEFYSLIYQKRFGHCPEEGYNELEEIMGDKAPSLGYFILAQIISNPPNNIVLTTNFDTLLEDAVRSYTNKIPFVAGHEFLADYIPSNTNRPIILKLHRDLLLHPYNTTEETGKLHEQWEKILRNVLSSSTLIVLGYGGNDGSLMNFLEGLPLAQRKAIYWCVRREEEVTPRIKGVLKKDSDRVVLIKDFDEFMYQCGVDLGYKPLFQAIADIHKISPRPAIIEPALDRLLKIDQKLQEISGVNESLQGGANQKQQEPSKREEKKEEVSNSLIQLLPDVYRIVYQARQEEKTNPEEADEIYRKGIEQYPNSTTLLGSYAVFLENIRKDYDKAEEYYLKALDANPQHANNLGNYASFLKDIRKDYDKAEAYYKRALDADPQHANNLGNYAIFLQDIRKDYDKAEAYYQRALEAEPQNANILGNYAIFLKDIRKDYDKAEAYYQRALDADPQHANNLGNYANLLYTIRKDYDKAEEHYLRALEIEPNNPVILRNYAIFLRDIRKDEAKANEYFRRAGETDFP